MRKLIYTTTLSLDGYIEAASGDPSWMFPDEELHRHFNRLEKEIDTQLYGRTMYEMMAAYWPTADSNPEAHEVELEYAKLWKSARKVVFSKSLQTVDWNSRLVQGDAVEEVAKLKAEPGKALGIGGSALASTLAEAGLIDEYRLYFAPFILGAGKPVFRALRERVALKLVENRVFTSGTILLRYQTASR